LKNARNGKRVSKITKWPSLRPLALKNKLIRQFEFLGNLEDLFGKRCWSLAYSLKNPDRHKFSYFNYGGLKLGHFGIFDAFFLFLAFFRLWPIILKFSRKIWSRDPSSKGPIGDCLGC